MKKTIVSLAIAASMVAPAIAFADATVYGNVHLSINSADNDIVGNNNDLSMSSNTSAIGVKGSEDLGDGLKAIYKVEFGVGIVGKARTNPDVSANSGAVAGTGALTGRDQFVGLKGGMGTVKFGAMSSNYKQMGGKVDPMYRTPLEGRGFLGTQSSKLHGGRGVNSGRQTTTVQYTSPKFSGIQLVANTTVSGSDNESTGVGVRWSNKNILAYVDWIDSEITSSGAATTGNTDDATKFGAKYHTKAFSVALQYESAADRTASAHNAKDGFDYTFLAGTYNINKNNAVALTYGEASGDAAKTDYTGIAVMYNHKLSKLTNVYAGYGDKSSDAANADESMLTFGIKKKF